MSTASLVSLGSLLAPGQAAAQSAPPSLDLRGFRASADPAAGLYLEPAASPDTREYSMAFSMSYAYRPLTLRDPATDDIAFDIVSHQLTGDLAANVGFGQRLTLGFDLPVLFYQTGDDPTAASKRVLGSAAPPRQALGDAGLTAKLTLVRPTAAELGGFALALHERLTVPSGDEASFMGEGAVTSETRLLAEYRIVALSVHAAAGVKLRAEEERFACEATPAPPSGDDPCPTRFGQELPFGLGFAFRPRAVGIDPKGRWIWYLETHGYLPLSPIAPFESARVSGAHAGLGARYAFGDASVLAGVQTALVAGVGNAPFQGMLSLAWAPRAHDADGDGIADDVDQCRELAEDRDRFQDDDGCPEGDNDDDGVPDADDRCPDAKEDEDGFQDHDGCPDPDNDGDGFADDADACPNEAGIASDDPKKRGCPVRDTDGDGIEGDADKCPDAPEDKDGFQDEDGCPDPDNDGDGIGDAEDACPTQAGTESDDPKQKGCPNPDADGDTLWGDEDKCPDKAEAWNGIDDGDGCPDEGPKKGVPLATIKPAKVGPMKGKQVVELSKPIAFTKDNEVDAASVPVLRALATELYAHPKWSVKVGVRPKPNAPPEDAEKRAAAVVQKLRAFTRRSGVAETGPWGAMKALPGAEAQGIGIMVATAGDEAAGVYGEPGAAPQPAGDKPAAPAAKKPAAKPEGKPAGQPGKPEGKPGKPKKGGQGDAPKGGKKDKPAGKDAGKKPEGGKPKKK